MLLTSLQKDLRKKADKKHAQLLQRFFKTGPGEYGEGDCFIGLRVPQIRAVVKQYWDMPLKEVIQVLRSKIHEERLAALLILVWQYAQSDETRRERIYRTYLKYAKYINNWDLVDLTAHHIVGAFLNNKSKKPIYGLARSAVLWERRIAVLATFYYIKDNNFREALKVAGILLTDHEDLIHKAVGWMLREIGKRDLAAEEVFLRKHYKNMPRTMLRYAIERFPERKRQDYLKGRI